MRGLLCSKMKKIRLSLGVGRVSEVKRSGTPSRLPPLVGHDVLSYAGNRRRPNAELFTSTLQGNAACKSFTCTVYGADDDYPYLHSSKACCVSVPGSKLQEQRTSCKLRPACNNGRFSASISKRLTSPLARHGSVQANLSFGGWNHAP